MSRDEISTQTPDICSISKSKEFESNIYEAQESGVGGLGGIRPAIYHIL